LNKEEWQGGKYNVKHKYTHKILIIHNYMHKYAHIEKNCA